MSKFGFKDNITDEDFIIHMINSLPKEYNVILNGIENCLSSSRDNALAIEVTCDKLNHRYKKIKNKNDRKSEKKRY